MCLNVYITASKVQTMNKWHVDISCRKEPVRILKTWNTSAKMIYI